MAAKLGQFFVIYTIFRIIYGKEWLPRCLNTQCEIYQEDKNRTFVASCEPDNVGHRDSILVHHLAKVEVEPKNATCGISKTKFCSWKNGQSCRICRQNGTKDQKYKPEYMLDDIDWRWWQSIIQQSNETDFFPINITIKLPMTFILTDNIVITFHENHPRDMFIEKSRDHGKTWTPMQYYSDNCKSTFKMKPVREIDGGKVFGVDGLDVFCLQKDSDTVLRDPNPPRLNVLIQRDILKNMPEPELCRKLIEDKDNVKSFLEITDLRIRLLRTAAANRGGGNQSFKKHYGIDQVSIKGRCQCNGHASECKYDKQNKSAHCECHHNTAGKDCSKCKLFFWMREWRKGGYEEDLKGEAGLCLSSTSEIYQKKTWRKPYAYTKDVYAKKIIIKNKCDCNGHSERCVEFNDLGKTCVGCRHNTVGTYCNKCKLGFWLNYSTPIQSKDACVPCNCNKKNSVKIDCIQGKCECYEGATGSHCSACSKNYHKVKGKCVKTVSEIQRTFPELPRNGVCAKHFIQTKSLFHNVLLIAIIIFIR